MTSETLGTVLMVALTVILPGIYGTTLWLSDPTTESCEWEGGGTYGLQAQTCEPAEWQYSCNGYTHYHGNYDPHCHPPFVCDGKIHRHGSGTWLHCHGTGGYVTHIDVQDEVYAPDRCVSSQHDEYRLKCTLQDTVPP